MPRSDGQAVRVNLRCTSCGYGVLVRAAPERCPMCGGGVWEHAGLDVLGRVLQARMRGESPDVRTLFRDVNEDLAADVGGSELELVCECGDGRCFAAVGMSHGDFRTLRAAPGHHVVLPGHEADDETAVFTGPRFAVVAASDRTGVEQVADAHAYGRPGRGRVRQ